MGNFLAQGRTYVDNAAHQLHHEGRAFPCDRDVEALQTWRGHALLLSSDTDCLSLYDGEGLLRTARVGVYPQDMAVQGDEVFVCGGADGRLHRLNLPELLSAGAFSLPGMVERVALRGQAAYVLALLAEQEVRTVLVELELHTGLEREIARFAGIPGALAADESGLWVGVSEQVLRLPYGMDAPDLMIEGFGLPRRITPTPSGALVWDELEERLWHCTAGGVIGLEATMEKKGVERAPGPSRIQGSTLVVEDRSPAGSPRAAAQTLHVPR